MVRSCNTQTLGVSCWRESSFHTGTAESFVFCVAASNPMLCKQDQLKVSELISGVVFKEAEVTREKLCALLQKRKKETSHVSRGTSSQIRPSDTFQVDKQLCIFKCGL